MGGARTQPVVVPVASGGQVRILGYCHRPRQYAKEVPSYAEGTLRDMLADVARLGSMVDHIVISLHGGEESVPLPSQAEVRQARSLVAAGASLILGRHHHPLRPVERYRQGLIASGLGNIVADVIWHEPLRQEAVLNCTIGGNGVGQAEVIRTRIDPGFVRLRRIGPPQFVGAGLPEVEGLEEAACQGAIARTIGAQRCAAFVGLARRLPVPLPASEAGPAGGS